MNIQNLQLTIYSTSGIDTQSHMKSTSNPLPIIKTILLNNQYYPQFTKTQPRQQKLASNTEYKVGHLHLFWNRNQSYYKIIKEHECKTTFRTSNTNKNHLEDWRIQSQWNLPIKM
jgi:hypothetical protein